MAARDAVIYLQMESLIPNVPLPTVTPQDANKLLVVNNAGTAYSLSAGQPVEAGVNSIQNVGNSTNFIFDPVEGTGDVTISINPNEFQVGQLEIFDEEGNVVYDFPRVAGTEGQVLGVSGGTLEFIDVAGSMLPAGTNINYTDNTVNVNASLTNLTSVQTAALEISGASGYSLPIAKGTEGQVLGINNQNALAFINQSGGGGTVNSIAEGANITVDATNPAVPIVGVVTNPNFSQGLSVKNIAYPDPTTAGQGQVLSCTGTNPVTLGWSNPSAGGISSVVVQEGPSTSFMSAATNNQIVTLSLLEAPALPTLTLLGNLDFTGTENADITGVDQLTLDTLTFDQGVEPNNISASIPPLSYNIADNNKVLTMTTTGVASGTALAWMSVESVGAVNQVSNSDSNLDVNPTTGNVVVNMAATIAPTAGLVTPSIVIKSAPAGLNNVSLPTLTDGQYPPAGYVIKSNGTGGTNFEQNSQFANLVTENFTIYTPGAQPQDNQNIVFPTAATLPTAGQILQVDTSENNTATLSFTNDLNVLSVVSGLVSITNAEATNFINLPAATNLPTQGQFLSVGSVNAGVATLVFTDNTPDGVQSVTGADNTVVVQGTTNVTVAVNQDLAINSITAVGGNFGNLEILDTNTSHTIQFPSAASLPTEGQYLTVSSVVGNNATLTFTNSAPDGVQSVTAATPADTIVVSGTAEDVVLAVNPDLVIESVTAQGVSVISADQTKVINYPSAETLPIAGKFLAVDTSAGGIANLYFTDAPAVNPNLNVATLTANDAIAAGDVLITASEGTISTATYTSAAGITGGDHVLATSLIGRSIYITSNLSQPAQLYSVRLPQINSGSAIPVNSLIAVSTSADTNLAQDCEFVTINNLVTASNATTPPDVYGGAPDDTNRVPLTINAGQKQPGYVLAVAQNGIALEWILNAAGYLRTDYYLINNAGTDTIVNLQLTAMKRGDSSVTVQICQLGIQNSNYCPIRTGQDTITGIFLQYVTPEPNPVACMTRLSGAEIAAADFQATYGPNEVGISGIPVTGETTDGVQLTQFSMGQSGIIYNNPAGSTDAICEMIITAAGIDINFIVNVTANYGQAFTIPANKNVQFQYEGGGSRNFSVTYFK